MANAVTLPSTIDPTMNSIHRMSNGHFYAGPPDAATATKYASLCDIIIQRPGTLHPYLEAMYAGNNNIVLAEYDKSIQLLKSATGYPERWYAHTSTNLVPSTRVTAFGNYYEMKADEAVSPAYTDSRGFTATRWREWVSQDHWKKLAAANNGTTHQPENAIYFDSMSQYLGPPVDPTTGTQIGSAAWHQITYTVGDQGLQRKPQAGVYVLGNGAQSGPNFMGTSTTPNNPTGSTHDIINHLDVVIAEECLRQNAASITGYPPDREVEQTIDMLKSVSAMPGKGIIMSVPINNATAGGSGFVPTPVTPAQVMAWRRHTMCVYLIGNDGGAFYEFVESDSVLPWNEDHPYYHVKLGAPVDNLANGAAYKDGATGLYSRDFANGSVFVNNSNSAVTFNPGAGFKEVDGTAITGTITIAAHDGRVIVGANSGGSGGGGGSTQLQNVLTDLFERTVAAGSLGTADTGQTYSLQGTTTNYSVDGHRAVVSVPLNSGRYAVPSGIAFQDMHTLALFQIAKLPTGDSEVFYVWVRRDLAGQNGYRLRCEFTSTGALQIRTQKVVANVATSIGTLKTITSTASIGDVYVAELQAVGINPTNLQASCYVQAAGPPASWMNNDTDSDAALQVATLGAGFSNFIQAAATNAPINVYVLEYYVDKIVAAPPTNQPPTIVSVTPTEGQVFATDPGVTTVTVPALANVSDTDGTVSSVTLSLNGASPQTVNLVGGQYTKSLKLGAGSYTLQWVATDDGGLQGTANVNFTVTATPGVVLPPPAVDAIPGAVEFVVQFTTHDDIPIGELKGTDLRFGRFIGQPGYISFDLDRSHPMAPILFSEPSKFDWSLQRNGIEFLAGELTTRDADTDTNAVSFAGADWMAYLDQIVLPFDPDNLQNSDNYTKIDADLTDIAEGLIAKVLNQYDFAIDIAMNNPKTGITQSQHFAATDLNTLKSMIDTLAQQTPGFEWEITHDKVFNIYAPKRLDYADLRCDSSNIKQVHYGLQGVPATTVYGRGSGSSSAQAIKKATSVAAAKTYRDRIRVVDFGTISSRSVLRQSTAQKLGEYAKQRLEFWVTIQPDPELNVWATVFPGQYVYVDFDDGFIQLSAYYRLAGYEGYVNAQGDEEVVFNFNTDDIAADGA